MWPQSTDSHLQQYQPLASKWNAGEGHDGYYKMSWPMGWKDSSTIKDQAYNQKDGITHRVPKKDWETTTSLYTLSALDQPGPQHPFMPCVL